MKKVILLAITFLPSPLRIMCWRMLGFKVGKGCRVSFLSVVVADQIELKDGCAIEPCTFIYHPRSFFMGENSRISAFTRIVGYGTFIMKSQSFIAIENLVDCSSQFTLGERSQLGPRSTCYTHGSTGLIFNVRYPHRTAPITIGNDSWLGMACIVYPGVEIGDETLIYAGTVVSKNVKPRTMVCPSPNTYITRGISLLQARVDDQKLVNYMEKLLGQCGEFLKGKHLTKLQDNVSVLECEGQNRIILIKQKGIHPDLSGYDKSKTVVWRLETEGGDMGVPTFEFKALTITGSWSPLAAKIVAILNEKGGTHFVFQK